MSEHALKSSLLKVQRASVQIANLAGEIQTFLDSKPYHVVRDIDHVAGKMVFRTTVREACPPVWSVLIGECLHDLRSALDYMVWELVVLHTGAPPAEKDKTQFPIFRFESGYDDSTKRMLKGVGSKPRTLIKGLQPFSTGEDERSPLWQLHELSNWDKHRSLRLAGAHLHRWKRLDFGSASAPGTMTGYEPRGPGPMEHNTVLLTATFTGAWNESSTDVEMNDEFPFDISLDKVGPVQGAVLIPAFMRIHQRVFEIGKKLSEFWPVT